MNNICTLSLQGQNVLLLTLNQEKIIMSTPNLIHPKAKNIAPKLKLPVAKGWGN